MKTLFLSVVIVSAALVPARAADPSPPIFRHHFLGEEAVTREKGATRAKEIGRLPETKAFLTEAIGKLATAPARLWPERLAPAGDQVKAWTVPLLEDLLQVESFSEIAGPTNRAEFALAVKLVAERAGLWSTNLWQLTQLSTGKTPRAVQAADFTGWEVELSPDKVMQLLHNQNWLVLGIGHRPLEAVARMLHTVANGSAASGQGRDWMELEVDLGALGFWLPVFRGELWPRIGLAARGENEFLRVNAQVTFRKPIPWTFEPWRIPTNSIVEPIVSFTVAQGIGPVLQSILGTSEIGSLKVPNQFCAWGQPSEQQQVVATFPVPHATNALEQLAKSLPPILKKVLGEAPLDFYYLTNRTMLVWQFLAPPAFPYMIPWDEGGQDFLLATILPVPRETNPPPAELFGQLGARQNLVYYDWELTEQRVVFATQVYQLYAIKHNRDLTPPTNPAQKWLSAARPLLGNCVTEMTRSGAKELRLERKSHLGLTGFELVSLVQWVCSPGFPLDFKLPPPTPGLGDARGLLPAQGP